MAWAEIEVNTSIDKKKLEDETSRTFWLVKGASLVGTSLVLSIKAILLCLL